MSRVTQDGTTGSDSQLELTEDYCRMMYAESQTAVEQARTRLAKKWRLLPLTKPTP